jgi:hypothetical protein
MIHHINTPSNTMLSFVKDDPVRPEISSDYRVSNGRIVLVLSENETSPDAMVCVSFHDSIPEKVSDLDNTSETPTTAIFYTIWSYRPGKGAELLINAVAWLQVNYPSITRFVTLSPKTPMARRFHLKNGAAIFRENEFTTNYEYTVSPIQLSE